VATSRPVRLEVLAGVLGCLCVATASSAAEPIQLATADITGPRDTTSVPHGLEFGAQFAIPLPTADIAGTEMGLKTGVSLTNMKGPGVGVGLDLAYNSWPASSGFKDKFNTLLRYETLNTLKLGGTTWRLSAVQVTGHFKFVAPIDRVRPWLKIGAGGYVVDPHVSGYRGDAGFFFVDAGPFPKKAVPGWCAGIGVDLVNSGSLRFGLDASYDQLWTKDAYGSDFDAFTVGAHVLFGR
jgi:hypothetical protein